MTYRSFTSAERLLAKLRQRFNVPAAKKDQKLPIQLRVVNLLYQWITDYWFDFTPKMQQLLSEFIETLPTSLAKKLQTAIDRQVCIYYYWGIWPILILLLACWAYNRIAAITRCSYASGSYSQGPEEHFLSTTVPI